MWKTSLETETSPIRIVPKPPSVSATLWNWGGKRARRQALGRTAQELADREYDIVRVEVFVETTDRFIATLASRKRLDLAREQFELATRVLKTVEDRMATGKTATIEKLRLQPLAFRSPTSSKSGQTGADNCAIEAGRHVGKKPSGF